MGIRCVHYTEQKDCTAGLDAGGICEIPNYKLNQVNTGHTGRTVHCTGEGPSTVDVHVLNA